MKNIDKYMDEYVRLLKLGARCDFVQNYVLKNHCFGFACSECHKKLGEWFEQEYTPQIDWSKVPVDTPVIATGLFGDEWNRYFAGLQNDEPSTFELGCTSWSTNGRRSTWETLKLARPEDIEKYSI